MRWEGGSKWEISNKLMLRFGRVMRGIIWLKDIGRGDERGGTGSSDLDIFHCNLREGCWLQD